MDFFSVVERRRSIRKFTSAEVPESVILRALEIATLAPNSSNAQTWDFYWVRSVDKRKRFAYICLNQMAAVTASDLIVVAIDPRNWKRSWRRILDFNISTNAPKSVRAYYEKIVPNIYAYKFFNLHLPLKRLVFWLVGHFRPVPRKPLSQRDLEELCIKSAALAAQNFVLAITAQGFSSCIMEGFDEYHALRELNLRRGSRVAMIIAIGEETQEGRLGPRYRVPIEEVIHRV